MKDTAFLLSQDIKELISRARGLGEPMCVTYLQGARRQLFERCRAEENLDTVGHMCRVAGIPVVVRDEPDACASCETNGGECELHPRDPTDCPDERDSDDWASHAE